MTTSPAILCRLGRGFAELRLLGILGSSYPRSCISLPIGPVPSASALSSATPRFSRDRSGLLLSFRRIITSGKDYPPSGVVSHRGPVPSLTPPLAQCYGWVRSGSSLWTGLASIRSWCRRPVLGFHAPHTPSSLERGSPRRCTETFCLPAFALALLPYSPSL